MRGRWIRVASLVGLGALSRWRRARSSARSSSSSRTSPLALLNLVAGLVYAIALPFVALVTAYVYFDARTRLELEPVDTRDELPAEITVDPV